MSIWNNLITLYFEWIYDLYTENFYVEGSTMEECYMEAIKEMKRRQWENGFVFVSGHDIKEPILLFTPRFYTKCKTR